jgi:hypothetical protein
VYIAPLKALVRERIKDWNEKLHKKLGKRVIELTGDSTPDAAAIANADVIVSVVIIFNSINYEFIRSQLPKNGMASAEAGKRGTLCDKWPYW